MSVTINGTNGLTFNDASTQTTAATGFGFKNRIINGAMVIDQRNAGASVAITTTIYCPDRYQIRLVAGSGHTAQTQTSVVPTGFTNSLKITVGTGASPTATQNGFIFQAVEGYNTADLGFGTANAATITISFWVRSSVTGTYGLVLANNAANRSYVTSYTVNAANTWEQKTITVAGDTTGTWDTTNNTGIQVIWDIGQGSTRSYSASTSWQANDALGLSGGTKLVATSGATFYITGVQLEKGSTATSFDYRPYGTELALCQRYCVKYGGTNLVEYMTPYGMTYVATSNYVASVLPVEMRSAPTVSFSTLRWTWQGGSAAITALTVENAATKVCGLIATTGGGETAYRPGVITANNSTSASLIFSAEL